MSIESTDFCERPICRVNGKHNEDESFDVEERNNSSEIDENDKESYAVAPSEGSTQRLSPSEYRNHPYSKYFDPKRHFKELNTRRPKPKSEEAKAPLDPYRRIEMRNKHIMAAADEGREKASSLKLESPLSVNDVHFVAVEPDATGMVDKEEIHVRYCLPLLYVYLGCFYFVSVSHLCGLLHSHRDSLKLALQQQSQRIQVKNY